MVVRNNNFSIKANKLIKYPHILSKFIPTFYSQNEVKGLPGFVTREACKIKLVGSYSSKAPLTITSESFMT